MKLKSRSIITALAYLALPLPAPSFALELTNLPSISLSELQRILYTGLDVELSKIAAGSDVPKASEVELLPHPTAPCNGNCNDKRAGRTETKTSHRRRMVDDLTSPSYCPEQVWFQMLRQAWDLTEHLYTSLPFLLCARDDESSSRVRKIFERYDSLGTVYKLGEDTDGFAACWVGDIGSEEARWLMKLENNVAAQPWMDLMKVNANLFEEVVGEGWAVPYNGPPDASLPDNIQQSNSSNATEADSHEWQRVISVEFVPSEYVKNETKMFRKAVDALDYVHNMSAVGSLDLRGYDEEYRLEANLLGIPALSHTFSITHMKDQLAENSRLSYWNEIFLNGVESKHGCRDMFSTMSVRPNHKPAENKDVVYDSFLMILNPMRENGSHLRLPKTYEGSASNPACVASLIAGLAVHPRVMFINARGSASKGQRWLEWSHPDD